MMILTSTNSISGKIKSIIREAKDELYLISPYIQLNNWDHFNKAIKFAQNSGVKIKIIIRKPLIRATSELDEKKFNKLVIQLKDFLNESYKLHPIDNLYSKVYYNGSERLITSMNLYLHSVDNNF
ncbi:MAG: hypothetical protein ACTSQP_18070 [Promethearchaeota archaeon]